MGADPDRNAVARDEGGAEGSRSGAGPASQPSASGAKQRVQIPKPGTAPVIPPPARPMVPPPGAVKKPTSAAAKTPAPSRKGSPEPPAKSVAKADAEAAAHAKKPSEVAPAATARREPAPSSKAKKPPPPPKKPSPPRTGTKRADAKSADAKSAGAKSAEPKSADAKSADAKTTDAKSADAKSAPAKGTKPDALGGPKADGPPKRGSAEDSSTSRPIRRDPSLVLELDAVDRPVLRDEPDPIATFARFELLGRLATGGMAEIFLARESLETAASRHTAIKIIRGEFAEDGDFANMFLDEGRLAMRLTHPNICTVYECGRHAGRFFMAMEYVHGQTLREVLVRAAKTKRTMPIPTLLKIFAIVAEALDFAHRARDSQGRLLRIVHRDVSPHNVMVRYDGVVKLLDFGVAKAEHSSHATEAGALKGKFSYMSPEQAMAEPIDHRADIFSLGVCIFEAVTGRRLFHRKAQYDTLKAILEQEPPALSSFRDDVPEGLQQIVLRALAKKPDERYQRAAELQHDLEHLLTEMREVVSTSQIAALMEELFVAEMERGPPLDTADDIRERFAPASAGAGDLATTLPPPKRRAPMWAAAAAGLAIVLGGGVWALSNEGAEPTPTAGVSSPPAETPVTAPVDPEAAARGAGSDAEEPEVAGAARPDEDTVSPSDPTVATATSEPAEGAPNAPIDAEDDATLPASAGDPPPAEGEGETGGADDGPEEAASGSTTGQRGRGRGRGERGGGSTRGRGGRGGGGTVIVTDPGF